MKVYAWRALSLLLAAAALAVPVQAQQDYDCQFGLGNSKGFWSNPNGRATLEPNDTAWRDTLNDLHLADAAGNAYDVPGGDFNAAHGDFREWIVGPPRGNMAHILSQQLAALVLNLEYGALSSISDPHVDWRGNKVLLWDLIDDADDLLRDFPMTNAPSAERDDQEELKDLFDALNNNDLPVCEPTGQQPPATASLLLSADTPEDGAGEAGCAAGTPAAPAVLLLAAAAALLRRRRQK